MAINYTISYTFAPNTTILSAQVNTNFSDNANTWTGLEAKTKSFSALQIDATPSVAADVVRKDYVDSLMSYRRPILKYNSGTVVNIETGIDGTSGEARILFPDGSLRKDSSTSRIQCNLSQVAALSGSAQSGLRTGSVANNTWYAIYAVKTSDNSANFVAVADTILPLQANFATLNSNFGTNSWVYLGLILNGDNGGTATGILNFLQCGNETIFLNIGTGNNVGGVAVSGMLIATTAGAATLTILPSAGTGAGTIPNNVVGGLYTIVSAAVNSSVSATNGSFNKYLSAVYAGNNTVATRIKNTAFEGVKMFNGSSSSIAYDIWFSGFTDGVLGVGSNPIL